MCLVSVYSGWCWCLIRLLHWLVVDEHGVCKDEGIYRYMYLSGCHLSSGAWPVLATPASAGFLFQWTHVWNMREHRQVNLFPGWPASTLIHLDASSTRFCRLFDLLWIGLGLCWFGLGLVLVWFGCAVGWLAFALGWLWLGFCLLLV